jgi:uracil-DNA glycosylase family 4
MADEVRELARELKSYLRLLDRAGLRWIGPGEVRPIVLESQPWPDFVDPALVGTVEKIAERSLPKPVLATKPAVEKIAEPPAAKPAPAPIAAPRPAPPTSATATDAKPASLSAQTPKPVEPKPVAPQPPPAPVETPKPLPAAAPAASLRTPAEAPKPLTSVPPAAPAKSVEAPPASVAPKRPAAPAKHPPAPVEEEGDLFGGGLRPAEELIAAPAEPREDENQLDLFGAPAAPTPKPAPKSAARSAESERLVVAAGPVWKTPPLPREERVALLRALAEEVAGCVNCPLSTNRTNTVPGEGNPEARLMFIGEGPGRNEDLQGRPFVGEAGQLLDKMIAAMTLSRETVYIANAVKCRPPNNRDPKPEELAACEGYLLRQIEIIRPEGHLLLGAHLGADAPENHGAHVQAARQVA